MTKRQGKTIVNAYASATHVAVITQSDSADNEYMGVYVGEAGNLKVTIDGVECTFSGIAAGTFLPIATEVIWSTGSTAFTAGTLIGMNW